jgi:hypothetical protein
VSLELPHVSLELPRVSLELPHVSQELPHVSQELPHVSQSLPHEAKSQFREARLRVDPLFLPAENLLDRDGAVVVSTADQLIPGGEVMVVGDAVAAREGAGRGVAFEDEDVGAAGDDDDAPGIVGILLWLVVVAEGDVVVGEVAEIAVGVVPGGEAGQVAARAAHHLDVQSSLALLGESQGKVGDSRGVVEVEIHVGLP